MSNIAIRTQVKCEEDEEEEDENAIRCVTNGRVMEDQVERRVNTCNDIECDGIRT